MLTYETIWLNINDMPTCQTILRIINPNVDIWSYIVQYKQYVSIWNHTAHYELTSTYEAICAL